MSFVQLAATALFAIAILHTFSVKKIAHWAGHFSAKSKFGHTLHHLSEVELVFAFWSIALLLLMTTEGWSAPIEYLRSLSFTEPLFVLVILVIAATRPVIASATAAISAVSRLLPLSPPVALYLCCLIIGPLLGSFITEPAAMTVTAMILREHYFTKPYSLRFKYLTLGTLFVNVSVGGAMTPYAAPPLS